MQDKCKHLLIDMVSLMNAITALERRPKPPQELMAKLHGELKAVEKELESCEGR